MLKNLILVFVLFIPSAIHAQVEIGDIRINTFESFFNPENRTFWDEIGAFNVTQSSYWRFNFPSMINLKTKHTVINLVLKTSTNYYTELTQISNQLNRQFGQSSALGFPPEYPVANQGWKVEEKGATYLLGFGKNPDERTLYLFKITE